MVASKIERSIMVCVVWDRHQLEKELRVGNKINELFSLTLGLRVNDTDILGGVYTFVHTFFLQIYAVFSYFDPLGLEDMRLYVEPSDWVDAHGIDSHYALKDEDPSILTIKYRRIDMNKPEGYIEVPFQDFVKGILDSNRLFIDQCLEIRPDLIADEEFLSFQREMIIVDRWYRQKWSPMESYT
ncbi:MULTISPECIES: hypothetical protein [unclassified Methanoculleus]|jgi:hypothetical protein|uniref:hypothetical protein n=1 Tax=unclassified Methanoculleus TaxID=2619537 RepID=UPI0025E17308|nr:hypothetical protein [Methanoculleus sp. UBA377]MDD2472736.1 hypothetical protein [Methanoculleus sp.]